MHKRIHTMLVSFIRFILWDICGYRLHSQGCRLHIDAAVNLVKISTYFSVLTFTYFIPSKTSF